jgi:membrane protein EpsK
MGWWVIIDQIGTLFLFQIDLIVVNLLFGASSAGEYAIALQWAVLLRTVANMISGVLTPMVFIYYAKGEIDRLKNMMISAVKLMGILMAIPVGLICGFSQQIVLIWVGEKFVFLAPLIILLTLHLSINLSILPLFPLNVAFNKLRLPGIVTFLMGGINLSLAILIPLFTGWGVYGVAAALVIVLTMRHAFFVPWYTSKITDIKASSIIRSMVPGIALTLILIIGSTIIGIFIPVTSMLTLIIVGMIMVLVSFLLIWTFCLSVPERENIKLFIPKMSRKSLT